MCQPARVFLKRCSKPSTSWHSKMMDCITTGIIWSKWTFCVFGWKRIKGWTVVERALNKITITWWHFDKKNIWGAKIMRLCILSATLFNGISVDSTEEKSKSLSVFDNQSSFRSNRCHSSCWGGTPFFGGNDVVYHWTGHFDEICFICYTFAFV